MNKPDITPERLRQVLNYNPETGVFTWKIKLCQKTVVGAVAGTLHPFGYVYIKVEKKKYRAHRLAWLYMYGQMPPEQVDHINRVRNDNSILNLRLASQRQNMQNAGEFKHNTSGAKGVGWYKRVGLWRASISCNKKHIHIGYYKRFEDAKLAREIAEIFIWHETHPLVNPLPRIPKDVQRATAFIQDLRDIREQVNKRVVNQMFQDFMEKK